MPELELSVSEFVASINQTLEFAYPTIAVSGELANFRVSKGQWVYFDLKDELASLKCFGNVFQLPGPMEDGMLVKVKGAPRLHTQYGFSFNIQRIQPLGEGSLRKAADLLAKKLEREGLFDQDRKREVPFPPRRIGLITSSESAAYSDFVKILNARWRGVEVDLIDVLVQGDLAPTAITDAISYFNERSESTDVLVITRGGGSLEDLWTFNTEQVTRAVAASRIPTVVAIGHENDISLAELAADKRASTPSNAAELLVPDSKNEIQTLFSDQKRLDHHLKSYVEQIRNDIELRQKEINNSLRDILDNAYDYIRYQAKLLGALSPDAALRRGYAIIRQSSRLVRSGKNLSIGAILDISLVDAELSVSVRQVELKEE